MPAVKIPRFGDDMPVTHLLTSRAVIWASDTRHATLFVTPTIDDPESKEPGKQTLATEAELTLFAFMYPPATYSPCAGVLRVYFDYDTGQDENMLKLTSIRKLPKVLASLKMVVRRSIYLSRR